VVRPYAVTGGRTEPGRGELLDLLTVVAATGQPVTADDRMRQTPEHRAVLALCGGHVTVADLAAETGLPVGVVRVLLADLTAQGAITVAPKRPPGQRTETHVLQEILNGLRAL
jgi:predicted Rossmann fold nucleotide-binding protein DprA/Smf involved in DNA uptake